MYGELPEKDEVSTLTFTLAINSPGNEMKSLKSISNFCTSLKDGNKKAINKSCGWEIPDFL